MINFCAYLIEEIHDFCILIKIQKMVNSLSKLIHICVQRFVLTNILTSRLGPSKPKFLAPPLHHHHRLAVTSFHLNVGNISALVRYHLFPFLQYRNCLLKCFIEIHFYKLLVVVALCSYYEGLWVHVSVVLKSDFSFGFNWLGFDMDNSYNDTRYLHLMNKEQGASTLQQYQNLVLKKI